jgi:hypothetical protein
MESESAQKKAEYRKNYYKTHKDYYYQKKKCDICGHQYMLVNKSHHYKTKRHNNAVNILQIQKLNEEITAYKKILKKNQ